MVTRDYRTLDVMRVDTAAYPEKVAVVSISPDGKQLSFNPATGFIGFLGGAKTYHAANFLTFHRVENFRRLAAASKPEPDNDPTRR